MIIYCFHPVVVKKQKEKQSVFYNYLIQKKTSIKRSEKNKKTILLKTSQYKRKRNGIESHNLK